MSARVIIADDHVLIREGLRKVLAREPGMRVVGEAADGPDLVRLVGSTEADVVLMDVNMPGEGSLETLQRIATLRPGLPVLMISMLPEELAAPRYLQVGAAGYVSKEAAAEELVGAIRQVLAGGRYVSQALGAYFAAGVRPPHEALSRRELQVLRLIARGRSVKGVAETLAVSVSTVHTHRARVLEKLDLRSDVDIARYAVRHGLVDS
jgi:DNA-binding NarL/FixJ family response regulator